MSQHSMSLANQAGASYRSDNNNAIAALVTLSSGATAPSVTFGNMFWADTTSSNLKKRNSANSAWVTIGGLDAVGFGFINASGATMTGLLNLAAGANIASAATVDLTAATGNTVDITGTTTTTAITMNAGQQMWLIPQAAWPLTHHATNLNLLGGVNYTCAAGDRLFVVKDTAGVVYVTPFKADGTPVVASAISSITKLNTSVVVTDTGTDGAETVTIDGVVAEVRNATGKTSYVRGTQGGNSDTALPEYQCRAWVNFDGTTAGTFAGGTSTVTRIAASTLCTVTTTTPHGLTTGNSVFAATGVVAGLYTITVLTATTFTFNTAATTALSAVSITFNTRSIRGSGNVNSIAYSATGDYVVNFNTTLSDTNYVANLSTVSINANVTTTAVVRGDAGGIPILKTTAALRLAAGSTSSGAASDIADINVTIFR